MVVAKRVDGWPAKADGILGGGKRLSADVNFNGVMHAHVVNGKCRCDAGWKGPLCIESEKCPDGQFHNGKTCVSNICQHGGTLAVGRKEIECICEVPWDGRYCDRLACWRKTKFGT
ncbi:EGF-like domain protein [Oesophagostomum dentatum]|uniref:EGF-like domain protein n=1 Tax=Oesophagostomum dentatum TaxID=61180 RepID=A0A0B1SIT2_OESDE|nr:EGF-like domain protein [Oesophagostomum dentatum]